MINSNKVECSPRNNNVYQSWKTAATEYKPQVAVTRRSIYDSYMHSNIRANSSPNQLNRHSSPRNNYYKMTQNTKNHSPVSEHILFKKLLENIPLYKPDTSKIKGNLKIPSCTDLILKEKEQPKEKIKTKIKNENLEKKDIKLKPRADNYKRQNEKYQTSIEINIEKVRPTQKNKRSNKQEQNMPMTNEMKDILINEYTKMYDCTTCNHNLSKKITNEDSNNQIRNNKSKVKTEVSEEQQIKPRQKSKFTLTEQVHQNCKKGYPKENEAAKEDVNNFDEELRPKEKYNFIRFRESKSVHEQLIISQNRNEMCPTFPPKNNEEFTIALKRTESYDSHYGSRRLIQIYDNTKIKNEEINDTFNSHQNLESFMKINDSNNKINNKLVKCKCDYETHNEKYNLNIKILNEGNNAPEEKYIKKHKSINLLDKDLQIDSEETLVDVSAAKTDKKDETTAENTTTDNEDDWVTDLDVLTIEKVQLPKETGKAAFAFLNEYKKYKTGEKKHSPVEYIKSAKQIWNSSTDHSSSGTMTISVCPYDLLCSGHSCHHYSESTVTEEKQDSESAEYDDNVSSTLRALKQREKHHSLVEERIQLFNKQNFKTEAS